MAETRLEQQLRFFLEIDRLKTVERRTSLADASRLENSAEHSWHLAVMALLLTEHEQTREIDLLRVLRMVLVHDIVEIDAGDTFCYDPEANIGKEARERQAARRIFGLLPDSQGRELLALWEEFEAQETPEARYAAALDRIQPVLLNLATDGGSWRRHGIRRQQVEARNRPIGDSTPGIWGYILERLDELQERGALPA